MSDLITRCPKCSTAFKVQPSHLNSAKGAVRCGSCLHVFNAKEHLISSPASSTKKKAGKKPASNRLSAQQKAKETAPQNPIISQNDDDILISDDTPFDEEKWSEPQPEEKQSEPKQASFIESEEDNSFNSGLISDIDEGSVDFGFDENVFFGHEASSKDINLFEKKIKEVEVNDEDDAGEDDESWALSLLEDEERAEQKSAAKTPNKLALEEPEPEAEPELEEAEEAETSSMYHTSSFRIIDEQDSTTSKTDDELDGMGQLAQQELSQRTNNSTEPTVDNDQGDPFDIDHNVINEELEPKLDAKKKQDNDEEYGFEPFEGDMLSDSTADDEGSRLDELEAEPLEFLVEDSTPWWRSGKLWLGLNVMLLLSACFQLAYFKFDDWSLKPQWRPYYAQACQLLGCQLPALKDLGAIKIESMLVLDHPEKESMLLVDATLLNRAGFAQDFPELKISFSDINNRVLSDVRFSPSQYVGGELAGRKSMPPRHPIHITLDVEDPGKDAVNYQISVVKP